MNTIHFPKFFNAPSQPLILILIVMALLIVPLNAFAVSPTPSSAVYSTQLAGTLAVPATAHYYQLEPTARDTEVSLKLTFGSQSDARLINNVNFWVLTPEALAQSRTVDVRYSDVALAAGSKIFGKDDDYTLWGGFTPETRTTYTVIVYNRSSVPADYTLTATNGTLIDLSGQSKVAVAGAAMRADTPSSVIGKVGTASNQVALVNNSKLISSQLNGLMNGTSQPLYYTVKAVENADPIKLNFDYDPKGNVDLSDRINFFVFNADGLEQLKSGERPEFANLAAGSIVKDGETKLSASFKPVPNQDYVIMVVNRSIVPANFTLSVENGDFQ